MKKNNYYIKNKAFFLDRDGVINKDTGYILKFSQFKFLPGVKEAINLLNKENFLVIIITNQAAIGKGLLSEDKLKMIHEKMKKEINKFKSSSINDIFFSPYLKTQKNKKFKLNRNDRKPNIGMFLNAKNKWNINFKDSYFIGDKYTDKIASNNAGNKILLQKIFPYINR